MAAHDKLHVSLNLPADLVTRFDRIAALLTRDRAWVMSRALTQYLNLEGANLLEDAEGFAELDAGRGVDIDDVLEGAEAIIAAAEVRRASRAG
jgi:predicted transcriptional regulator